MTVFVNGEARDFAGGTLAALLEALGLRDAVVATAVNGGFVPAAARQHTPLVDGDAVEILAPKGGG